MHNFISLLNTKQKSDQTKLAHLKIIVNNLKFVSTNFSSIKKE